MLLIKQQSVHNSCRNGKTSAPNSPNSVAEATRRQAEIATVTETIAKLEATLPIAQKREADFTRLVEKGYITGHATQDKTRERIEQERDLAYVCARLTEAKSGLSQSIQAKTAYRAETLRLLNDRNAQAATKHQQLNTDQSKATLRERLTQLTAPVAGTVQQLAIHTAGGVVTSAQPLMIIVPDERSVTAEVTLDNKDIGFVFAGQAAEIKLGKLFHTPNTAPCQPPLNLSPQMACKTKNAALSFPPP